MLSTGAACWFCVVSPAAANPVGYGIPLVTAAEQPEQRLWELWLPYTGGFALWFNCLLIRMHNLFVIPVKQSLPFALALSCGTADARLGGGLDDLGVQLARLAQAARL